MARYVINVALRTVHDADCPWQFEFMGVVPWPRFEYDGQTWCKACLPRGLPTKPKLPFVEPVEAP